MTITNRDDFDTSEITAEDEGGPSPYDADDFDGVQDPDATEEADK